MYLNHNNEYCVRCDLNQEEEQQYNRDAKAQHLKELRKIKYGEPVKHYLTKLREASDKLADIQEKKRIDAEFDL